MKKCCRRLLSGLLAAVLVCLSGIPRGYAQIVEGYTYTVIFYPGNQGRFASTEALTVQSDTARVSFFRQPDPDHGTALRGPDGV